jgi:pilus assembly protein CpaB
VARRTLLVIASILLAALGTALIWLYVQGADNRAQQSAELVHAYVFTREAPAGTPATALPVTRQDVPKALAANAVTNLAEVSGLQLTDRAVAGLPLLRTMLATTTSSGITPTHGAFSLTIADPNRVPVQLKAGHHVAIYAYGGSSKAASLVTGDIQVLSVGSTTVTTTGTPAAAGPVPATIVGFDATPQQAADLVRMLSAGQTPVLYDLGTGTKAQEPSAG